MHSHEQELCGPVTRHLVLSIYHYEFSSLLLPAAVSQACTCAQVGPHISVLKTHVDIFTSWTPEIQHKLQNLAEKHGAPPLIHRPTACITSLQPSCLQLS